MGSRKPEHDDGQATASTDTDTDSQHTDDSRSLSLDSWYVDTAKIIKDAEATVKTADRTEISKQSSQTVKDLQNMVETYTLKGVIGDPEISQLAGQLADVFPYKNKTDFKKQLSNAVLEAESDEGIRFDEIIESRLRKVIITRTTDNKQHVTFTYKFETVTIEDVKTKENGHLHYSWPDFKQAYFDAKLPDVEQIEPPKEKLQDSSNWVSYIDDLLTSDLVEEDISVGPRTQAVNDLIDYIERSVAYPSYAVVVAKNSSNVAINIDQYDNKMSECDRETTTADADTERDIDTGSTTDEQTQTDETPAEHEHPSPSVSDIATDDADTIEQHGDTHPLEASLPDNIFPSKSHEVETPSPEDIQLRDMDSDDDDGYITDGGSKFGTGSDDGISFATVPDDGPSITELPPHTEILVPQRQIKRIADSAGISLRAFQLELKARGVTSSRINGVSESQEINGERYRYWVVTRELADPDHIEYNPSLSPQSRDGNGDNTDTDNTDTNDEYPARIERTDTGDKDRKRVPDPDAAREPDTVSSTTDVNTEANTTQSDTQTKPESGGESESDTDTTRTSTETDNIASRVETEFDTDSVVTNSIGADPDRKPEDNNGSVDPDSSDDAMAEKNGPPSDSQAENDTEAQETETEHSDSDTEDNGDRHDD